MNDCPPLLPTHTVSMTDYLHGTKLDREKPDLTLVPYIAQVEEAKAFMAGKKKYGFENYKQPGLTARRCLAAALRHIAQLLEGEQRDEETGAHHLGCARASLAMALWMVSTRGSNLDDDGSDQEESKPKNVD